MDREKDGEQRGRREWEGGWAGRKEGGEKGE